MPSARRGAPSGEVNLRGFRGAARAHVALPWWISKCASVSLILRVFSGTGLRAACVGVANLRAQARANEKKKKKKKRKKKKKKTRFRGCFTAPDQYPIQISHIQ